MQTSIEIGGRLGPRAQNPSLVSTPVADHTRLRLIGLGLCRLPNLGIPPDQRPALGIMMGGILLEERPPGCCCRCRCCYWRLRVFLRDAKFAAAEGHGALVGRMIREGGGEVGRCGRRGRDQRGVRLRCRLKATAQRVGGGAGLVRRPALAGVARVAACGGVHATMPPAGL